MIRRPPRSTLFPYTTALPICAALADHEVAAVGSHVSGSSGDKDLRSAIAAGRRVQVDLAKTSRYRSEEHTSELQSQSNLVCRLLLDKKKISSRTQLRVSDRLV